MGASPGRHLLGCSTGKSAQDGRSLANNFTAPFKKTLAHAHPGIKSSHLVPSPKKQETRQKTTIPRLLWDSPLADPRTSTSRRRDHFNPTEPSPPRSSIPPPEGPHTQILMDKNGTIAISLRSVYSSTDTSLFTSAKKRSRKRHRFPPTFLEVISTSSHPSTAIAWLPPRTGYATGLALRGSLRIRRRIAVTSPTLHLRFTFQALNPHGFSFVTSGTASGNDKTTFFSYPNVYLTQLSAISTRK